MKWIMENWSMVIILLAMAAGPLAYLRRIMTLPEEERIPTLKEDVRKKIIEWLKGQVTEAEKNLGGGTGELKLRNVYDVFVRVWPNEAEIASFKEYSEMVDEALEWMRKQMESNDKIKTHIEGEA